MTTTHELIDDSFDIYYGTRPHEGEVLSGDEVFLVRTADYVLLGIIDGLGHGKAAYQIAQEVKTYIETNHYQDVESLMRDAHRNFQGSRGAVVGLAKIQNNGYIEFIGIGNVSCKIMSKTQELSLLSKDGALGIRTRNICTVQSKIESGAQLLMYSDGFGSHLFRNSTPLPTKGSRAVVRNLIEQFGKKHDDVSLIFLNKKTCVTTPLPTI